MQALINADKEPITPLVARIRALANRGVSCVLVVGGSGDYFEVADHVIAMESFRTTDVTRQAREIASRFGLNYRDTAAIKFPEITPRTPKEIYPGKPLLLLYLSHNGCLQSPP